MKKLMIMVASLALVASFAMTAAAADWNFYGSARIATFWLDDDSADDTVFSQGLQGNARFGAKVKVSDELTGGFEYGTGVNVRKLYGEWNFGGGSLLVGQTYSPLNMFYSNQVYGGDTNLLNTGGVYSGREAMLQLKFGDVKIAAVESDSGNTDMPAIEASYGLSYDAVSFKLAVGWDAGPDNGDASYVVALGGSFKAGGFALKGNFYLGDNAEQLIWTDGVGEDNLGYLVAAAYTFNDMVGIELGYGNAESDTVDEAYAYYAQLPLTLAPGVFVIPELGQVNNGDDTYWGAKWQINF